MNHADGLSAVSHTAGFCSSRTTTQRGTWATTPVVDISRCERSVQSISQPYLAGRRKPPKSHHLPRCSSPVWIYDQEAP